MNKVNKNFIFKKNKIFFFRKIVFTNLLNYKNSNTNMMKSLKKKICFKNIKKTKYFFFRILF